MNIYNVGDKIRVVSNTNHNIEFRKYWGLVGIITEKKYNNKYLTNVTGFYHCVDGLDIEPFIEENKLINNNKNMNIIEKMKLSLLGEPLKTLVKAGIRNGDGSLTDDGQLAFSMFLQNKLRKEFDDEMIEEIKKDEEENKAKK